MLADDARIFLRSPIGSNESSQEGKFDERKQAREKYYENLRKMNSFQKKEEGHEFQQRIYSFVLCGKMMNQGVHLGPK